MVLTCRTRGVDGLKDESLRRQDRARQKGSPYSTEIDTKIHVIQNHRQCIIQKQNSNVRYIFSSILKTPAVFMKILTLTDVS